MPWWSFACATRIVGENVRGNVWFLKRSSMCAWLTWKLNATLEHPFILKKASAADQKIRFRLFGVVRGHHYGAAINYCRSCVCDLHCITWTEQRCQLAPHVPNVVMLLKVSRIGREILRMAIQRHAMKAYRGSRCIAPLILKLGIG